MAFNDLIMFMWNHQYLKAVIYFVGSLIVMYFILWIFKGVFTSLAKKTKTKVDDIIVEKTRFPFALLIFLLGARLAVGSIQFPYDEIVGKGLTSLIIVSLTHVIVVVSNTIIKDWGVKIARKTKSSVDDELVLMLQRFIKIALYLVGIMYVLAVWDIQIGPLLASLGIAGIAVAFALQTTLGNLFGGISLILDKTFRVGDIVQLDDGQLGEVKKVSLRSTKLRTFDNELVTVPNGKLADSKIINWNMPDLKVRVNIPFGVEYGSSVARVKKVVMEIVKKHKNILKDPAPQILFREMADSSLNFLLRFWLDDIGQKVEMKDKVITEIYDTLNKNKIGIPFPTRTVYNIKSN